MKFPTLLFALFFCQMGFTANSFKEYRLNNHLQLIVQEDHRAPVVVSMIWYHVGGKDEPLGKTGLSHALEHLMFKGTTHYGPGQFSKIIADLGGQQNALTHQDYTVFFQILAAKNLDTAFKLESDRMSHLSLDPKTFMTEKKVIQEERRMRIDNNPQGLLFERFAAVAQAGSPYQNPVIGWRNDINSLDISDLKNWYQTYYRPNNATLVVVGDVRPQAVYELAKHYFGGIKEGPLLKKENHIEPHHYGKKSIEVVTESSVPMQLIGFAVPSVKTAKEIKTPFVLEVIAGLLGGGESGRLNKSFVRGSQIASQINVFYDLFSQYDTQFMILSIPAYQKRIAPLEKAILEKLEALKTQKVSAQELEKVKNQILAQKIFEKDSFYNQAMLLGVLTSNGINLNMTNQYLTEIKNVTPQDIEQVAKHYFIPRLMTVATLIPKDTK